MDFVNDFLNYTSIYESPSSFWKWSAYCSIAAVLRDSCYKPERDSNLYPNIYVLLLADSAIQRKDRPVIMCEALVRAVNNTKLITGRSSIQAIQDELHKGETSKEDGKMKLGGSAILILPELSAGIISDPQAVQILTDIYVYKKEYPCRTRGGGVFFINNVCLSMMAASNKELLVDIYDPRAVYGGLLGRTFLILPNEFRKGNSLFDVVEQGEHFKKLVSDLTRMSKLSGPFIFQQDAQKEYDNWYLPFRESYKNKADRSGISGRIHTGIIKLSMLLAVNYTNELIVRKDHIEEAINECMVIIPNYTQLTTAAGRSDNASIGMIVINDLHVAVNYTLSKRKILQNHWNAFTEEELEKLVATLVGGGLLSSGLCDEGINYTLTEKCLEILFRGKT